MTIFRKKKKKKKKEGKNGFFKNFDKFNNMLINFWPFWPWKPLFFDAFHWNTPYFCALCHWNTPFLCNLSPTVKTPTSEVLGGTRTSLSYVSAPPAMWGGYQISKSHEFSQKLLRVWDFQWWNQKPKRLKFFTFRKFEKRVNIGGPQHGSTVR